MSEPRDPNVPPQYPQWQQPGPQQPGAPQPGWELPGAPQPAAQPAPPGAAGGDFAARLAARPRPRLGPVVAGLGGGLIVGGIALWGVSYVVVHDVEALFAGGGASSRHLLAALAAFGAVLLGYALAIARRRGPLATAGVALALLGVPLTMVFLTYSTARLTGNIDAVTWVSIIVWAVTFAIVPGLRGRPIFVFAALNIFTGYVSDKVSPDLTSSLTFTVGGQAGVLPNAPQPQVPWGTIAAIGMCFGLVYYLVAWRLDVSGRRALAGAVGAAGLGSVSTGLFAALAEIARGWVGLLTLVFGVVLGIYGHRTERRITTWFWAAAAIVGAVLISSEIVHGSPLTIGAATIVLGAILVVVGVVLHRALDDENAQPTD